MENFRISLSAFHLVEGIHRFKFDSDSEFDETVKVLCFECFGIANE